MELLAITQIFGIINNNVTEQLKKFVLAQKKDKVETVETYYRKLKNYEKRNKTKSKTDNAIMGFPQTLHKILKMLIIQTIIFRQMIYRDWETDRKSVV